MDARSDITVIGLDPSLANTGIAVMRMLLPENRLVLDDLLLAGTEGRDKKVVRKNSDDLRRAEEIASAVEAMVNKHQPAFLCSEVPHGSQSSRGMMANGIVVGILACLRMRTPLIQIQADETKLSTVGKKTASKAEMIAWAVNAFPEAPWLRRKTKGEMVLLKDNEHLADAVAVVHAGVKTEQFRQALSMFERMRVLA